MDPLVLKTTSSSKVSFTTRTVQVNMETMECFSLQGRMFLVILAISLDRDTIIIVNRFTFFWMLKHF